MSDTEIIECPETVQDDPESSEIQPVILTFSKKGRIQIGPFHLHGSHKFFSIHEYLENIPPGTDCVTVASSGNAAIVVLESAQELRDKGVEEIHVFTLEQGLISKPIRDKLDSMSEKANNIIPVTITSGGRSLDEVERIRRERYSDDKLSRSRKKTYSINLAEGPLSIKGYIIKAASIFEQTEAVGSGGSTFGGLRGVWEGLCKIQDLPPKIIVVEPNTASLLSNPGAGYQPGAIPGPGAREKVTPHLQAIREYIEVVMVFPNDVTTAQQLAQASRESRINCGLSSIVNLAAAYKAREEKIANDITTFTFDANRLSQDNFNFAEETIRRLLNHPLIREFRKQIKVVYLDGN